MSVITPANLASIVREHFSEAYLGANGWSWFVDHKPGNGIFGVLADVTAEQASQPGPDDAPSIAAHTEHLRFSLELVNETMRGKPWNPDWSASWSVHRVDDGQWRDLVANLRREFEQLRDALTEQTFEQLDQMALSGILALAPHAAHHLGTIKLTKRSLKP